jgi:hypothetical protein
LKAFSVFNLTLIRIAPSRTQITTKFGEDVRKKELSYTAGENVN